MITKRPSDEAYHLDYEWSAEMFCEIVALLWQQMQAEKLVPAHYHLHLPATREEHQQLIDSLGQYLRATYAGTPPAEKEFVFAKNPNGTYVFALTNLLQVLVAAWTGLGKKPVFREPSPYGFAQRSHHLLWFLEHYQKNEERLSFEVPVNFYPRMLRSALCKLCVPKGFKLVWYGVSEDW
jgi:hypothetical protein